MSGILRNFHKNLFFNCCIQIRANSLETAYLNQTRSLYSTLFRNLKSVRCLQTCAVLDMPKKVKEKMKIQEYISPKKRKKVVDIWNDMTIAELAQSIGKEVDIVFELLEYTGKLAYYDHPTDVLSNDDVLELLTKGSLRPRYVVRPDERKEHNLPADRDVFPRPPAPEDKLVSRPPVVTIMGHVDHGKTTLLDYLRKSSIVDSEFGGITQHIGAFSVKVKSRSITFLDTPGHAAFKAMRSRGAHCTDIVILVVAADDGVMEQTEESIRMAKDANVPIIVAINKIDKHNADIELTKRMLCTQNLIPEEMDGDTQVVPISALKGTNIDSLVEAVLALADLLNLRAEPTGMVEGVVLESRLDPHRGKLSTALIRRGTLKKSNILTAGLAWCKVKSMLDEHQKTMNEALPSTAVEVIGWKELPMPGDIIIEVESEKRAHEVIRARQKMIEYKKAIEDLPEIERKRKAHEKEYKAALLERRITGRRKLKPDGPKQKEVIQTYFGPQCNIVIKSDVEGSLEALLDSLGTYNDHRCRLDVVHSGVGSVSVADVEMAKSFDAIVYNFNVDVLPDAYELASQKNVLIRPLNIIYRFLEDVKEEINKRLPLKEMEEVVGEATILELFSITDGKKKNVPVAGCRCTKGELRKNLMYKVIRNGVEIHTGSLYSMKNLKTDVMTIKKEQDCGLRFEDPSIEFKPGDVIQCFRTYMVPQYVNWDPFHA